jgi:glycosyltransferase involved in cell wall biosynthesis
LRRLVHYYPGALGNSGVTFALWAWARAQATAGFEVTVLHGGMDTNRGVPEFVSKSPIPGLTVQHVPHRGNHRVTRHPVGLARYLGRRDLLILHEGWVTNNIVAARAARRLGVPYIVMPHGVYDPAWTPYLKGPRAIRDPLERRVLEGANAVHVFFESEMAGVVRVAPAASFLTVPIGFDVPHTHWTGGGDYLSWLGRIDPVHKGLDILVGGMALLPPAVRPSLRIHGYDYQGGLSRLQSLVADRGLGHWVRFGGALAGAEKLVFLQEAMGYVHPSRWDSNPVALVENLALGVPSLVSNSIHMAGALAPSSAAVLVPPTEEAIAQGLLRLTAERDELSAKGRAFVAETFAWNVVIPRFLSELERLGLD